MVYGLRVHFLFVLSQTKPRPSFVKKSTNQPPTPLSLRPEPAHTELNGSSSMQVEGCFAFVLRCFSLGSRMSDLTLR